MKIIKGKREKLEKKAAKLIEKEIKEILKEQLYVTLAVPGGSSVKGIFRELRKRRIPWKEVHIFMLDERIVPLDSEESNFKLVKETLLDYLLEKGKIPEKNIHAFNYQSSVESYSRELKRTKGKFDIVLASSGEDGHIASLFPNHSSIKEESDFYIGVKDAPKLPKRRISASKFLLKKSPVCILLFFGEKKKEAFEKFKLEGSEIECPTRIIKEVEKPYVFLEKGIL